MLKGRGHNIRALTLVLKMRPANPAIAIVARELALRLAAVSFPPGAVHTPGFAHVLADRLPRVFAPSGTGIIDPSLHPALVNAQLIETPVRVEPSYRALLTDPPPANGT